MSQRCCLSVSVVPSDKHKSSSKKKVIYRNFTFKRLSSSPIKSKNFRNECVKDSDSLT